MKSLNEIKQIIKQNILIDRLDLEDITAEDIQDNDPLFGEGLGLDSVEALDVVAGIESEFGVKLQGMDQEAIRKHFHSVEALSQFVSEQLSTAVN
ncbi:phosphopantetheine-binding protein [Paenibacillus sp. An7]|uniref:phosphopantetheine-binding protein n=1 Tax=Paenibacillus sp. An7 TaxID=2689577 RepID=UPI0013592908|nr:phosphopantetheine-binding protein [Paenibacillus sp. An7]